MQLQTVKAEMIKPREDQPNVILVILDSLNWTAWTKAKPVNIPTILDSEARKVHSPACCTLPTLIAYLSNYPPIGIGYGLFDKGIWVEVHDLQNRVSHAPTRAWMPKWYKDKGYHTSIFSGNAVLAEADQELCISRFFDHWGVMKYLKEEWLKATPVILRDFEALCLEECAPLFSVLWLFDTHYPFSDGRMILQPDFRDGYRTMQAQVKALRYTDETVFPSIVESLSKTGRGSRVIVTSDHGENHGGLGAGHNPFHSKLEMSDDLFSIPFIEGEIEA